MKKLTLERKEWLIKRQGWLDKKEPIRRKKRKILLLLDSYGVPQPTSQRSSVASSRHPRNISTIPLPSELSLDKLDDLVSAVSQIRRDSMFKSMRKIDFCPIKKITPAGALILASEIDRTRKIRNTELRTWKYDKWHDDVKSFVHEIGIFELLDVPADSPPPKKTQEQLKFVRMLRGEKSEGHFTKKLRLQLEQVGVSLEDETNEACFIALTEAMTNTSQHAYEEKEIAPYWWLCGSFLPTDNMLTVMFFDKGIGIPKTFEKNQGLIEWLKQAKREWWNDDSDSSRIRGAFEYKRTSTGKSNRGLGISQYLEPLKIIRSGTLRILSGKGHYECRYTDGTGNIMPHNDLSCAMNGTYIEWELKLKGGANEKDN